MLRLTPHTYLRIGGYAMAAALFCLLLLFLTSTPLDPMIQGATLLFYLVAILAMGGILHSNYARQHPRATVSRQPPPPDLSSQQADGAAEVETPTMAHNKQSKQANIILLSKHDRTARRIREHLSGWSQRLEVVGSCAEASQQILNRAPEQGISPATILIVDARALGLDPIHLPALIAQETSRASVKLVGIFSDLDVARVKQLRDAGFSALLDTPIEKSQLFAAISAGAESEGASGNVVNLAHYRQRHGQHARKHILLAEQNDADRNRIAGFLRAAGHRVKTVLNGEQVLDALEHKQFDLVLVNLHLPILNGTQVIKLHRFTTPHPQWVNFIVMTDQTTPATLRMCRDLQVRACFFKPVPSDALLEMIDMIPVVAPPAPAVIQHTLHADKDLHETHFLHADLLDVKVLQTLERLDSDENFVPHLISIFDSDNTAILQGMDRAVELRDTHRFLELANILMDNAGQLGAFALYETCLSLQEMSRRELNESLPAKLANLHELIARTNLAFQHYLSQRQEQHSDQS